MNKHTHPEDIYLIRAVSNLHAGSGDRSFGLIDKEVQRDPTSKLPVVFSSSVKGALREAYQYQVMGPIMAASFQEAKLAAANAGEAEPKGLTAADLKEVAKETHKSVSTIFGSDNRRGKAAVLQQGNILVRDATIVCLPVRSTHQLYFLATTPGLLNSFLQSLGDTPIKGKDTLAAIAKTEVTSGTPLAFGASTDKLYFEHQKAESVSLTEGKEIDTILGSKIALYTDDDFCVLCENLPTVARNSLNNGISENLWYEEIVPRETVFYCPICRYGHQPESENVMKDLHGIIQRADGRIQMGANATVGYGITEWTNLNADRHA